MANLWRYLRSRSLGDLLLGPPEVTPVTKGTITFVCMLGCSLLGFRVQQHLIEKFYGGEQAEMHLRVKQIKEREMLALARAGGATEEDAVLQMPKGETALIHGGGALLGPSTEPRFGRPRSGPAP